MTDNIMMLCIRHADPVCGIGPITRELRKAYAYRNIKTGRKIVSTSPNRNRDPRWERI